MAGYTRQSAADIVPTAVVRAAPINNELNAIRDAFVLATGHKHDGTAAEGSYVPVIADSDAKNKVAVDTSNNRISFYTEVSTVSTEQLRIQDGAIVPVTDDDIDLGSSSFEFKNLFIDGIANIDSLVADTADINGGTIDAAVIGSSSAAAITGTLITATTGFSGPITGAVTGNVTGNLTGNVTGNVTGNLTGNVTASTGTSTFNNVTISGTLDMDGATSATIINLASPTNSGDAATKGYVDTQVSNLVDAAPGVLDTLNELAAALGDDANFSTTITNSLATKLNLSGGTMTGAIAMGTNKITGMGDPSSNQDAATKVYVDTQRDTRLALAGGTMSGAIAMGTNKITGLGDPSSNQDAVTKIYIDTLFGSTVSAAASAAAASVSASNALTSENNASSSASAASTSASNAANSATSAAASYDSFDDRYLGAKSSVPTVDNDGDALLTGALYWNTTTNQLYVWDGSAWDEAAFNITATIPVTSGGTGLTSYATGDLLYASASTTLSKLTKGSYQRILTAGVSIPEWTLPADVSVGNADKVTITPSSSNTNFYLAFAFGSGSNYVQIDGGGNATYNPSTNTLTVPNFVGDLTGNASTVTNGVYTTDTGTVTNTMLAGSIANNKLVNSSITIGTTTINLGDTTGTLVGLSGGTGQTGAGTTQTLRVGSGGIAVGGDSYFANSIGVVGTVTATSLVGPLTGNASTATTLQTARTIQTNLASTSSASFNGSANITPGVTGTLPVANGGTGITAFGTGVATALGQNVSGSGSIALTTSPTFTTPVLGTPTSGTLSNCTVDGTDAVGFRNTPINSQSTAYTLVLADAGKTILHPISDDNARTFTIPANSSVAYPVGTVITFVNLINTVTIAITSDTMYLAGDGSTGSRTLAAYGVATAVKLTSTSWLISGNGLT